MQQLGSALNYKLRLDCLNENNNAVIDEQCVVGKIPVILALIGCNYMASYVNQQSVKELLSIMSYLQK